MLFNPLKLSKKYAGVGHKDNCLFLLSLDNETITIKNVNCSIIDSLLSAKNPDELIESLLKSNQE